MSGRYVIEGEWTGYHAGQRKVVHRTVHQPAERKRRAWCEANGAIRFTDGTCLRLSVRDCKPRERVQQVNGYGSLIGDCVHYDVASVDALEAAQQAARANFRRQVEDRGAP